MFKNVSMLLYLVKKVKISLFILLLFLTNKAFSMVEDDIYNDPYILKIFNQNLIVNNLSPQFQEELGSFTEKSALKQHNILNNFHSIQDQLENNYKKIKKEITNRRLFKYGISATIALAIPLLSLRALNSYLPEESRIDSAALPFVTLQGSGYFMFKFLEVLSRRYIASWDGAIQDYEIHYVRNKPLFEKGFCKVFENKLVAAHKNPSNLYDYLKWFEAATLLPISKKATSAEKLDQSFEASFLIVDPTLKKQIREICLHHIVQNNTRNIVYFYGSSGTGKTRCAREIAHCLALPFGSIALANYSVSDLVGQGGSHLPHPGKIAETILNAKDADSKSYTNMVLLIDEADKILNAEQADNNGLLPFLLTFLDPDTKSYYSPYFEKNIWIKDMLIILGGNTPLKNDALRKRLINVEFLGFEKSYREEYIINQYIPKLYNDTEEPYKLSLENHFSQKDKKMFLRFIEEDEDPGLRSVQERARKFVNEKLIKVYFTK